VTRAAEIDPPLARELAAVAEAHGVLRLAPVRGRSRPGSPKTVRFHTRPQLRLVFDAGRRVTSQGRAFAVQSREVCVEDEARRIVIPRCRGVGSVLTQSCVCTI
jgi:hypothetical protein